jgi:hypothetical protein
MVLDIVLIGMRFPLVRDAVSHDSSAVVKNRRP